MNGHQRKVLDELVDRVAGLMPDGAIFDVEFLHGAIHAGEVELVIETMCDQLYEYEIRVDSALYQELDQLAEKYAINQDRRGALLELLTG